MDEGGPENGRQRMECYRVAQNQWNMMHQYQVKDQDAFLMHRKIMQIAAERDAAFAERERALSERKAAIDERDAMIHQRDAAITERYNAIRERDNAMAALRFQESTMNSTLSFGTQQRGSKRMHQKANQLSGPIQLVDKPIGGHITDAFPVQAIPTEAGKTHKTKQTKLTKAIASKPLKSPRKGKKISEDLNIHVRDLSKAECDDLDFGMMNQINFDPSTMPPPVCSCTGVQRQCHKSGNGGWQSSCCTTTLSVYPLPRMENKRQSRMGGRKMSGTVFTKLLNRVAAQGHDLGKPLDLREYWAKHGTNRYITLK